MILWIECCLTAIVALLIWHLWRFRKTKGPFVYPVVGSLPELLRNRSHMHDWITKMLSESGWTYQTYLWAFPGIPITVTSDPRNIDHILKTNFRNYPKGPHWQSAFHDLLGAGIFNSDGESWLTQRKTAALEFTNRSLKNMIINSINRIIRGRLWPVLEAAHKEAAMPVDLQDILLRFTFDNICHFVFGKDPGSLAPGLPRNEFADAFDAATEATLGRLVLPTRLWRLKRALGLGTEKQLARAVKEVDKYIIDIVRDRNRMVEEEGKVAEQGGDLLRRFARRKAASAGAAEFARDVAVNFILAGRDTTAVGLTWFFWLLGKHPRVEAEVVKEIEAVVERRSRRTNGGGGAEPPAKDVETPFTYGELEEMHYLKAALTEALRLYPPVPLDTKYAEENDRLPDGTHVAKGSSVTFSIYAMGRMAALWGTDCLQFRPERWLAPPPASAAHFLPFNAGPRLCLGRDVAYLQMKAIAAAVLHRWRLSLAPGHFASQKMSLTLFMDHGLHVNLHPRCSPPPLSSAI